MNILNSAILYSPNYIFFHYYPRNTRTTILNDMTSIGSLLSSSEPNACKRMSSSACQRYALSCRFFFFYGRKCKVLKLNVAAGPCIFLARRPHSSLSSHCAVELFDSHKFASNMNSTAKLRSQEGSQEMFAFPYTLPLLYYFIISFVFFFSILSVCFAHNFCTMCVPATGGGATRKKEAS